LVAVSHYFGKALALSIRPLFIQDLNNVLNVPFAVLNKEQTRNGTNPLQAPYISICSKVNSFSLCPMLLTLVSTWFLNPTQTFIRNMTYSILSKFMKNKAMDMVLWKLRL